MRYSVEALPGRELMPGFVGRTIHSDTMSFVYWTIAPGAILPEHSHPHEQVVNMLKGELRMVVDGAEHHLGAGDVLVIPGAAVHSGECICESVALDVFYPIREDYRAAA